MSKRQRNSSTPHRMSRSSTALPSPGAHYPIELDKTPLDQTLLGQLVEMNDNLVDLDSNLQSLQAVHESLISFNESFASFLYGLQINAYTVEFNELPDVNELGMSKNDDIKEKIRKLEEYFSSNGEDVRTAPERAGNHNDENQGNETYMTNDEDGSFLVQPTRKKRGTDVPAVRDRDARKSRIPVGRRMTTTAGHVQSRPVEGGILKPTMASERRQREPVQKSTRPPFR